MRSLLASLLVITTCVAAETPAPAPAKTEVCPPCAECPNAACTEITLTELRDLVAAKKVVLIDANGSESFKKGHIPGAIDFAANKADLAKVLPAAKDALLVAYCGGPQCGAWKGGAQAAAKLGYTNIRHFAGGLSGWTEAKAPIAAD